MLVQLKIENVILIDSSSLEFEEGFHVFSGETGAGKTAILHALSLALGARIDSQIIRRGKESAQIEAHFELSSHSPVFSILQEAELEIDPQERLVIRREIKTSGKNKLLINQQWAPLHLLKKIAPFLVEIVSQHSTQSLLDLEVHRQLLDQFGGHTDLALELEATYTELQHITNELQKLRAEEKEREALQKRWEVDLEELEEAKLSHMGEEEELFSEYERLSCVNEQIHTLMEITHALQDAEPSLLALLKAQVKQLARFSSLTPKLKEIEETLLNTSEELNDASYELIHYRDTLEEDPERLSFLEERLKLLAHLKKRYGPTLKEVIEARDALRKKVSAQLNLSTEIDTLQHKIYATSKQFEDQAQMLTQKRIRAKDALESKARALFKVLNLSHAELLIELKEVHPDRKGNESVEFFLRANTGEKKTSLRDKVSGGELSRVYLTLKLLLAELQETPTLIFDEIDANLGGETAPKIGQLLKKVSESKQVFAITHLPQVAIYGQTHFVIQKKQAEERTYSLIEKLSEKQKVKEIERMLGGKELSQKAQILARDLLESS